MNAHFVDGQHSLKNTAEQRDKKQLR